MAENFLDERKVQVATITGLEVDRIGSVAFEMDLLRRQGLLVDRSGQK